MQFHEMHHEEKGNVKALPQVQPQRALQKEKFGPPGSERFLHRGRDRLGGVVQRCIVVLSQPFRQGKAGGVGDQNNSKASVKECQTGSLRFTAGESHAFPNTSPSRIGGFKKPANGDGTAKGHDGTRQREFGHVLDSNLEGNGVPHRRQYVIGAGNEEEGPKTNPRGGGKGRDVLCGQDMFGNPAKSFGCGVNGDEHAIVVV